MAVNFSDLQLAFEFVSSGGMGENEAYLDRRSGKIYWLKAPTSCSSPTISSIASLRSGSCRWRATAASP
jgi:hypothetical protein